jgi:putative tricarboxylic transport membrane protein
MNPLQGLQYGFGIALTPENLIVALAGSLLGTALAVLPGMGPTLIIALLLAPTAGLPPETALIMLGAVYYGCQYGASITAILVNVPAEAQSVVMGYDGHQMALKGRAGKALSASALGSFMGSTIGLIGLLLLAIPLSKAALTFGPPQFCGIAVVGLVLLLRISTLPVRKGIVCMLFGLGLTTIGLDPITGQPRLTFGIQPLGLGISVVPVVMGLIGFAGLLEMIIRPSGAMAVKSPSFRSLFPSRSEWGEVVASGFRNSPLGFILGMLPGPTVTIATFVAYRFEQLLPHRKGRVKVGEGAIRAVAGPKAADDAAVSGNLVPLLALGIPFSPVTAVLFAGLVLHGVEPGPLFISAHPNIFWSLIAAMVIGNVALLVLNFPLVGLWTWLVRIPQWLLCSAIIVLMLIGAFGLRNSLVDVYVMVGMGVLGYAMNRWGFDRTLVILGVVLGTVIEDNMREALQASVGNVTTFVSGPISGTLTAVLVLLIFWPLLRRLLMHRVRRPAAVSASGDVAASVEEPDLRGK